MEIIARKNKLFNIAATYILEGDKVVSPYISILPKGLFKNCKSLSDLVANDGLVTQISMNKVEANTVEELEILLDQQEENLINAINKKHEGVAA